MKFTRRHRSTVTAAIFVLGASLLSGCLQRTVITAIRHPMATGDVTETTIDHQYRSAENNRGLPPGALSDEAAISRMDAEAICFEVHFRQIDEGGGQRWTALENWRITVRADALELAGGVAESDEHVAQVYDGLNPVEVQVGEQTVCTRQDEYGQCLVYRTEPLTEVQMLPGPVTVVRGGGTICFPNRGEVGLHTTRLLLNLGFGARTRNYEWQMVP